MRKEHEKRKRFYIYCNKYFIVFTHKNTNRTISLYEHINRVHYINIGSLKTKYEKRYCYICGCKLTHQNRTKDHIPQRCLYEGCSSERKKNRLTIYCCLECNTNLSENEQELRNLIGITSLNRKNEKKIIKSSIKDLSMSKNSERLLFKNESVIGVQFERDKIVESVIKALKGIVLVLYNILITNKFDITVYSPNLDQNIIDEIRRKIEITPEVMLRYEKWYKSGNERIFRFRIVCLDKEGNVIVRNSAKVEQVQYIISEIIYWESVKFMAIAQNKHI